MAGGAERDEAHETLEQSDVVVLPYFVTFDGVTPPPCPPQTSPRFRPGFAVTRRSRSQSDAARWLRTFDHQQVGGTSSKREC